MNIGQWVRRRPGNRPKWHLVDSLIEDRIVTRCGRQMHRLVARSGSRLQVSDTMPLTRAIGQPQLCRQCHPSVHWGLDPRPEDDPTVGQVDPT